MQVEKTWVYKAAKYAMNSLKEYLEKHPDVATAFIAGGFLASPAGQTLMKGIFTKIVPMLAKFEIEAGKASAKLIGEVINQLLVSAKIKVDPKVVAEASKVGPDASKLNEGSKKVAKGGVILTAAVVAGQMVGSYFGNTIASFKGYKDESTLTKVSRIVFPAIHSVTDWVEEMKASKEATLSQLTKKTHREETKGKELSPKQADPNVSYKGEPNKVSGYTGYNYDQAAKELGMSARPIGNAIAENEWKKEVERNMSKKTKATSLNSPSWYFQGLAKKIMGTNLTWTGIKGHNTKYPFVSCVGIGVNFILPTNDDKKLHRQVIANNNIVWQALRGKNTGAFQYTEKDVFYYEWTLASLIAVYRFTAKLISLSNKFDVEVESLPKALLGAFYTDMATLVNTGTTEYNNIISNKSNYVTALNSIGKEINTYALKAKTLISRWNYLADKCIKDYNGPKAVYGYYMPRIVLSLDASVVAPANAFKYTSIEAYTVPQLLAYLQGQLDAIRQYNSGVLLKVAGDMIKLLGANKETFDNVPYINGSEVPTFEYDPEAFDQIRNAKILPLVGSTAPDYDRSVAASLTCNIDVTGGAAISDTNFNIIASNWMVTSDRKVEFKPEENLQMIQFNFNAEKTGTSVPNGFELGVKECGVSLLDHLTVMTYDNNGDPQSDVYCGIVTVWNTANTNQVRLLSAIKTLHGTAAMEYTDWLSITHQIDFLPRHQLAIVGSGSSNFFAESLDVDNYAYMSNDQFSQMNNVAVYSLTYSFNPEDVKIMGLLG